MAYSGKVVEHCRTTKHVLYCWNITRTWI